MRKIKFYYLLTTTILLLFKSLAILAAANNVPNLDQVTLSVWANEAIVATYSYDYKNFLTQQKVIAKYFTAAGWTSYSSALNISKLPEMIQKNSYFVSSVALLPPEIKNIATQHWQAIMPLLVIYKNDK